VRFQLKRYASEAVIFDAASGDTHYLAPLALTLFELFHAHPGLARDEARRLLVQRHGLEPDASADTVIDETLDGLCRTGLIRLE
jgi:PqqD family protein of HPr-rel-A system